MNYIGWDWASGSHHVTMIDAAGGIVDRWAFTHTEAGLLAAVQRMARHGSPAEQPVIIERPTGLVVDRLLGAGHPVVPVHPNSFHAARPRWGASGAKSDPGDSTSSLTTCAPTVIECGGWTPWTRHCVSCRPWSVSVTTRFVPAPPPPTS